MKAYRSLEADKLLDINVGIFVDFGVISCRPETPIRLRDMENRLES